MKLEISSIGGAATHENGLFSLGVRDKLGRIHSLNFSPGLKEQLLLALLASTPANQPGLRESIQPAGIARFRGGEDRVGIVFYLQPGAALNIELPREGAQHVLRLIETFDDASSWETGVAPKAN